MQQTTSRRLATAALAIACLVAVSGVAAAGLGIGFSVSSSTTTLNTADGTVTISGTGTGTVESVSPWLNVSSMIIGASNLTFDAEGIQTVTVSSGITEINVSSLTVNDNETDLRYKAGTPGGIVALHNLSATNRTLSAVNASGSTVDTATVSNGTAEFVLRDRTESLRVQAPTAADIAPVGTAVNASPDTSGWVDGATNATLATLANYVARVPGVAVGGSGLGGVAALALGIVVVTGIMAAPSTVNAGPVAGAVVGTVGIAAVVSIGLAPQWLWVVALFGIGGVGAAVVIRLWS